MEKAPIEIVNKLSATLKMYKQKPYLPWWGEFFVIIKRLIDYANEIKSDIHFYDSHGNSKVVYRYETRYFVIITEEMNINLQCTNFIDSLTQGRFWPLKV